MVHIVPTVMISFSSANAQEADCVEEALGGVGIRLIRYESDLRPQQRIDAFLDGYRSADVIVILLSEKYVESPICLIELAIASTLRDREICLVNVSNDAEYDIPAAVAISIHEQLENGEATWVREKLAYLVNTSGEGPIIQLLSKCFDRLPSFLSDGIAEICRNSNYMPDAYADMLNSIVGKEDIRDRESAFDDYLQHYYLNEYYLAARAKSYKKAGYLELSKLYYKRALNLNGRFPTAIAGICELAIDGDTGLLKQHFNKAMRLIDKEDLPKLNKSMIAHALALVLLSQATQELKGTRRKARLRKAKTLLQTSIRLTEVDSAYNALGQVFEELGNFQGALNCYKKSLALNGNNYRALNNYALLCQTHLGKNKEAIVLYERCLEIEPNYDLALDGYGLALEEKAKERSLQTYFTSCSTNYKSTRAITNAALILDEDFHEYQGAEALYRTALQKKPTGIVTNYNMASFLRRRGKLTREYMECLTHLSQASSNELVRLEYVLFNLHEKRYDEAAKNLETISRQCSLSPHLIYISNMIDALNGADIDLTLIESSDFPPLLDLAARLELTNGNTDKAEGLYLRALKNSSNVEYPPLAPIRETDFSIQLEWVEINYKRESNDRVARSQVVSVDCPILPPTLAKDMNSTNS